MAIFRGFKAFRPTKENQSVIPALPYDAMSSAEAREMVKDSPLSFLHVDRAEVDFPIGVDQYSKEVYLKAKENLSNLEANYMLQDETPCFYIYKQTMNGRSQVGIVGCASIDDYINNVIKKHEHTLDIKEQDRINHVDVCDANTGPIFLTYRSNGDLNSIVENYMSNNPSEYDFDFSGVNQAVWVISDKDLVEKISKLFTDVDSMYIADGHHRCASAVKVGEMRRKANPNYSGNEEFNFFLAVAFPDNQLQIMDYNRVVKDLNGYTEQEFISQVEKHFVCKKVEAQFKPSAKHTFGMLLNEQWYKLEAKSEAIDESNPIARLDVSILQDNLLSPILNINNPKNDKRIDFIGGIRGIDELERRVHNDMMLAFSMYPTTVEDLMSIADGGLVMPPKSTWFEPKLLSGLFIHHLS